MRGETKRRWSPDCGAPKCSGSGTLKDAQSRNNVVSLIPQIVPFKAKWNKHICMSSWPKHLTHSYLLATACLPPGMQLSPLKSNQIHLQQFLAKPNSIHIHHPSSLVAFGPNHLTSLEILLSRCFAGLPATYQRWKFIATYCQSSASSAELAV